MSNHTPDPKGIAVLSFLAILIRKSVFISLGLAGSAAYAQTQAPANVFFGFDFVLQPLAIKWACGGQSDQDMAKIDTLLMAFPEDAERAGLTSMAARLSEIPSGPTGLSLILGAQLDSQQVARLCAAAAPLNIDWVTPGGLMGAEEADMPPAQDVAWLEFWRVIDTLQ